jgi:lipopolysaccharide transport system ATP-binding protein
MSDSIIVEKLSKQYQLGEPSQYCVTMREALVSLPQRLFGHQRKPNESIWALKEVSFNIGEGEVVGIIGRNGAGKSTLLKLLSKITFPTSGRVKVNGRVASLLEIGAGFHCELTGRENILLNASILGMKRSEVLKQFDAIVSFAGVDLKFIDIPVKRYSSGMRTRLGFSVAAHLITDILLVDEILAVGDVAFQKKCMGAMDNLRDRGKTILFVSHNMAAVEHLCSRAIWIENGQVKLDGSAREVIGAYMGSFVGAEQTRIDVGNIQARAGNGEARFTAVEFLTREGEPLKLIRSGEGMTIRLHYSAKAPLVHPIFNLRIDTELGTKLTEMSTWMTDYEIPLIAPGTGYLDLEVEFLNLMPGRYPISLALAGEWPTFYDRLDHCLMLDVEPSDFYKTGKGIERRFGLIFLPYKWRLNGVHGCVEKLPNLLVKRLTST